MTEPSTPLVVAPSPNFIENDGGGRYDDDGDDIPPIIELQIPSPQQPLVAEDEDDDDDDLLDDSGWDVNIPKTSEGEDQAPEVHAVTDYDTETTSEETETEEDDESEFDDDDDDDGDSSFCCGNSIGWVTVSTAAHNQHTENICTACACATAVRSCMSRIAGYKQPPHEQLRDKIETKFGNNGASATTVLKYLCKKYHLCCRKFPAQRKSDEIVESLRQGDVVVAEFFLKQTEWENLIDYFKHNPNGILTREHLRPSSGKKGGCGRSPYNDKKLPEGHSVVITGYEEEKNKCKATTAGRIFTIKNSWGSEFANDGYFRIEHDAFPDGFDSCVEVSYKFNDLPSKDVGNYVAHLLQGKKGIQVIIGKGIKVSRCSSYFGLFDEATIPPQTLKNNTWTEEKAIERIYDLLDKKEDLEVTDDGIIEVQNSDHKFRVGVSSRTEKKAKAKKATNDAPVDTPIINTRLLRGKKWLESSLKQ